MNVKLINLCEYTVERSLYSENVHEKSRTAEERIEAQDFIENLGEVKNGIWKTNWIKGFKFN